MGAIFEQYSSSVRALIGRPSARRIGPSIRGWASDSGVAADLRLDWINQGFVVIKGVFADASLKRYNATVSRVRSEIDTGQDAHGFGDRVGQLHQREPELLELAAAPKVLTFLKWAFGEEPVLFGSLNFERGTEQDAHIDAIFFWPEPSFAMAGVWVALEDIHPDAGPLFYVPGSHRWPFYTSDYVVASRPELAQRRKAAATGKLSTEETASLVNELGSAWTEDLRALEAKYHTERIPLAVKAGDVVVWHSLLAHGGSPRKNPTLSRKSVVFHYLGRSTRLFTFEQFMLTDGHRLPRQKPLTRPIKDYKGRLNYMSFAYFVTYTADGQQTHSLTK